MAALSIQLKELARPLNETECGADDLILVPRWIVREAAAELDRREALVRAAEAWAKLIRGTPRNAVAFYHAEEALLALLPEAQEAEK